jgi:hypothetical protein
MQFHRVTASLKATNSGTLLFDNPARPQNVFADLEQLSAEINLPAYFDHMGWIFADSHEEEPQPA